MMRNIVCAIMPYTYPLLEEKFKLVSGAVDWIQLDIMDGLFGPEKTIPFSDDGLSKEEVEELLSGVNIELDLMVKDAGLHMQRWLDFNPKRLVFHVEAESDLSYIFDRRRQDIEYGLAFNTNTSITDYEHVLNEVDFVECMGIAEIGFQGNPFDEKVFSQIEKIRSLFPAMVIQVDGGVTIENAQSLYGAGVNRLVSGSAILNSENPKKTIQAFKSL